MKKLNHWIIQKTAGGLLCLLILLSAMGSTALAAGKICWHHTKHTDDCTVNGALACRCLICEPQDPAAVLAKFEDYELETVHPELLTMHVFDYWLEDDGSEAGRTMADGASYDETAEKVGKPGAYAGINYNHDAQTPHILHFVKSSHTRASTESKGVTFEYATETGFVHQRAAPHAGCDRRPEGAGRPRAG